MSSPFATFSVLPAYGRAQAAITWSLKPRITGNVYFYRSESGIPGSWTLLNPDDPQTGRSGEYLDTSAAAGSLVTTYWRGLVDGGGAPDTWLKGEVVTAMDSLTRKEYFLVRECLRREYLAMRRHNGIRAFHLIPKVIGSEASHADAETGQLLGPDCPGDPNSGYSTVYAGGFHGPVQTWVMLTTLDPEDHKARPDATGDDPEANVNFRLLAFPKPARGHLIVLPESDRRYVVIDPVERFLLRGSVPVAWEAKGMLLDRDDGRYQLPMPALLPE